MSSNKSGGLAPPQLTDEDKFNGTNYTTWSKTIMMSARVRGARGYLEGTIPKPSPPTTNTPEQTSPPPSAKLAAISQSQSDADTIWPSLTPCPDEWDARDAWCLVAIIQNVKNPIGIGLKTDGTAAEAWKLLSDRYKTTTDLARVYAQRELRGTRMDEGDNFLAHLSNLHTKHKQAISVGTKIDDHDFREIILTLLPLSWDTIISTIGASESSINTIIRLEMHWSRISGRGTLSMAIALKSTTKSDSYNKKVCTNPNCKRRGHLIADCYWKGGGKDGQFPAGFRQRGSQTGSANAATTATTSSTTSVTAAVATTKFYALTAMETIDYPAFVDDPKMSFIEVVPETLDHIQILNHSRINDHSPQVSHPVSIISNDGIHITDPADFPRYHIGQTNATNVNNTSESTYRVTMVPDTDVEEILGDVTVMMARDGDAQTPVVTYVNSVSFCD